MEKQLKMAIDMIAAGHNVETVIDITGVSPELLFDVLCDMLDGPRAQIKVDWTTHVFNSVMLGQFEINMN